VWLPHHLLFSTNPLPARDERRVGFRESWRDRHPAVLIHFEGPSADAAAIVLATASSGKIANISR
jgi:hypothetical protein